MHTDSCGEMGGSSWYAPSRVECLISPRSISAWERWLFWTLDDIIRGAFGTRFIISKLVDGDHFVVVGEHHNLVE